MRLFLTSFNTFDLIPLFTNEYSIRSFIIVLNETPMSANSTISKGFPLPARISCSFSQIAWKFSDDVVSFK